MTSFLVKWFPNLHILWNLAKAIRLSAYQPAKLQCCRLTESSFTEGLQKHNDDVITTSFHDLGFEISIFCETGYKLATCQVSNPSVI